MYKGGPSFYPLISMSTVSEWLVKTVSTLGVKYWEKEKTILLGFHAA